MVGAPSESPARRYLVLPARGKVLISTDLHGNGDDFRRLRELFRSLHSTDTDAHWVQLGDVVHGPNEDARRSRPDLYDYADESFAIVEGLRDLADAYPARVHFVLGNHEFGHVGGPHTQKFFRDEVLELETKLDEDQRRRLHEFLRMALLAVVAPCGGLLCHGSPDDSITSLESLDRISIPPAPDDRVGPGVLRSWLYAYGQPQEVTARLLATVSRSTVSPITLVIHGHDRDEKGWFVEGGNQLCPVIFGAPRANKRYVVLDLGKNYASVDDLREEIEIRRLYETSPWADAREIAHSLDQEGLGEEAQSLRDAIDGGSTGTEILMALRWHLQRIDKANLSMSPALRAKIRGLAESIDAALRP